MRSLKKEQQRPRQSAVRGGNVPLTTYYRSGQESAKTPSPFKKTTLGKKSGKKLLIKSVDVLVIIALALVIGYSLIVSSKPVVKATSDSYRTQAVYKEAISKHLGSLKNKNKFTFDERGLAKSIKSEFPEVSEVNIELPLFNQTPTFRLVIAEPSFILNSSGRLFIVGDSGRAVALASGFGNLASLIVVNDETGFRISVGNQVISQDEVSFLSRILDQAQRSQISVSGMTLPAKPQELHVRTSDRTYYVKFFLGGDPAQQIGQFLATRHRFDIDGTHPSEYLDVRVPGKVYYK